MKRSELASKLARNRHITKAQAADQLDGVVHDILRKLRHGKQACLPGLGTWKPGAMPSFEFEKPQNNKQIRKGHK